jgi:hypothetical protein
MLFVRSVGGSIIREVTIKVADKKDLEFMLGRERGLTKASAAYPPSFYMHLKDP